MTVIDVLFEKQNNCPRLIYLLLIGSYLVSLPLFFQGRSPAFIEMVFLLIPVIFPLIQYFYPTIFLWGVILIPMLSLTLYTVSSLFTSGLINTTSIRVNAIFLILTIGLIYSRPWKKSEGSIKELCRGFSPLDYGTKVYTKIYAKYREYRNKR